MWPRGTNLVAVRAGGVACGRVQWIGVGRYLGRPSSVSAGHRASRLTPAHRRAVDKFAVFRSEFRSEIGLHFAVVRNFAFRSEFRKFRTAK